MIYFSHFIFYSIPNGRENAKEKKMSRSKCMCVRFVFKAIQFSFTFFHIRMCQYSRVLWYSPSISLFYSAIPITTLILPIFVRSISHHLRSNTQICSPPPHTSYNARLEWYVRLEKLQCPNQIISHTLIIVVVIAGNDMLLLFLVSDPNLICYILSYLTFVSL